MFQMTKRLLIFHPTIAPYRVDFFNRLCRRFDTRVCLEYVNLKDQHFEDYESISGRFEFSPVYLRPALKIGSRTLYTGVIRQIRDFAPDIVIVGEYGLHAILALVLRFLSRRKYKVVTMTDDSYNMLTEDNDFTAVHRLARRIMAPMMDDFIVVEPRVAEFYRNRFGRAECCPIIKDGNEARKNCSEALGLSRSYVEEYGLKGKAVLLFVGRLVALKNVARAIEAFTKSGVKDSVFVIVGEGPEKEALQEKTKNLPLPVIFTGRKEGRALDAWYNIASALILPSTQEAFGAVTDEALLAGCMALVSKRAGSSSLVETGSNGAVFDPEDVEQMSRCIRMIDNARVPDADPELRASLRRIDFDEMMDAVMDGIDSVQ